MEVPEFAKRPDAMALLDQDPKLRRQIMRRVNVIQNIATIRDPAPARTALAAYWAHDVEPVLAAAQARCDAVPMERAGVAQLWSGMLNVRKNALRRIASGRPMFALHYSRYDVILPAPHHCPGQICSRHPDHHWPHRSTFVINDGAPWDEFRDGEWQCTGPGVPCPVLAEAVQEVARLTRAG